MLQAMAGDRYSFQELISCYQNRIHHLVYYRIRSGMDAEDLTQDIFLQAFRSLSGLKEADRFQSWLYRIAINRVRDFQRKKRFLSLFGMVSIEEADVDIPSEGRSDNGEKAVLRKDFWNRVRQLTALMSGTEREIFLLRFFDQLNIREISDTLGKSESTVKTLLYRAIDKFRVGGPDLGLFAEEITI